MSSVFLYLAIVGIWAFVLVPRWLRRSHPQPQLDVEVDVEVEVDYQDQEQDDADGGQHESVRRVYASVSQEYQESSAPATVGPVRPVRSIGPPRRSRVLQSRRRLLTMLVTLTVVAAACTALKLTSWWVCIPPVGMLGTYLLLLRETALADAEQARRRAAMELRVQAARQRAHAEELDEENQYSAQIIDISARVGDQLYDQYNDATVRAVGD